jgi:methylase of polypeptide subunit release factors
MPVSAIDVSEKALATAKKNAQNNSVNVSLSIKTFFKQKI